MQGKAGQDIHFQARGWGLVYYFQDIFSRGCVVCTERTTPLAPFNRGKIYIPNWVSLSKKLNPQFLNPTWRVPEAPPFQTTCLVRIWSDDRGCSTNNQTIQDKDNQPIDRKRTQTTTNNQYNYNNTREDQQTRQKSHKDKTHKDNTKKTHQVGSKGKGYNCTFHSGE